MHSKSTLSTHLIQSQQVALVIQSIDFSYPVSYHHIGQVSCGFFYSSCFKFCILNVIIIFLVMVMLFIFHALFIQKLKHVCDFCVCLIIDYHSKIMYVICLFTLIYVHVSVFYGHDATYMSYVDVNWYNQSAKM